MKLNLDTAELYIPGETPEETALPRTTHLAVAAHQDDIEIMAYDGILACYQQADKWFTGVVVTNGSGSPRTGLYADYSDEDMMAVRRREQKKAAAIGEYSAMFLLDYPSGAVKDPKNQQTIWDLCAILETTQPEIVYTHNLADKHDTHVGVALRLITAIRQLPGKIRPKKLYGCEVWRDLDWMTDPDKTAFDVSAHENLQAALLGIFDSQIAGGKRYDLATLGRRRAHATYHASHGVDETTGTIFAMDLTPCITDPMKEPIDILLDHIRRFRDEVHARVGKLQ